jgi:hypothetical protein
MVVQAFYTTKLQDRMRLERAAKRGGVTLAFQRGARGIEIGRAALMHREVDQFNAGRTIRLVSFIYGAIDLPLTFSTFSVERSSTSLHRRCADPRSTGRRIL